MSSIPGLDRTVFCNFPYPVYQLQAVGPGILLAAGGGGTSKTGVPNRIDVVSIPRSMTASAQISAEQALIPPNISIIGGVETRSEAVMHMALSVNSTSSAVLLTLEGSTCQEYLLCSKEHDSFSAVPNRADFNKEQDLKISSSNAITIKDDSSSSSSLSEETLTSTTSRHKKNEQSKENGILPSVSSPKKDMLEGSWSCRSLRRVSVAPTSALLERRRMDSCSSTSSASFIAGQAEDELNCIATGGPGNAWCAIGTMHGGVAIINRYAMSFDGSLPDSALQSSSSLTSSPSYNFTYEHNAFDFENGEEEDIFLPLKPCCALSDVSGGRCAVVCDVALSVASFRSQALSEGTGNGSVSKTLVMPLLATVSGKPLGSLLCIWRLQQEQKADSNCITPSLQAEVRLASTPATKSNGTAKISAHLHSSDHSTRFRHCEFLRWVHQLPQSSGGGLFTFLVTTEQPISPSGKSVCQLSTWLVPLQQGHQLAQKGQQPPVMTLERFASVEMPRGQLPACIAVHPSRHRGLIALGSMEGSVDVYVVSLEAQSLAHVYSMPKAHPIFVTSLAFLPPREQQSNSSPDNQQRVELHYELVSASADRVLRWHPGPSMRRVVAATSSSSSTTSSFIWTFFLLSLVPFFVSFLEIVLNHLV